MGRGAHGRRGVSPERRRSSPDVVVRRMGHAARVDLDRLVEVEEAGAVRRVGVSAVGEPAAIGAGRAVVGPGAAGRVSGGRAAVVGAGAGVVGAAGRSAGGVVIVAVIVLTADQAQPANCQGAGDRQTQTCPHKTSLRVCHGAAGDGQTVPLAARARGACKGKAGLAAGRRT